MEKTYTGTVKKVMEKGFGFIKCDELGKDVFYHNNNLPAALRERGVREGDKFEFSIELGQKGESAVNIKLVEDNGADEASDESTQDETDMPMAA